MIIQNTPHTNVIQRLIFNAAYTKTGRGVRQAADLALGAKGKVLANEPRSIIEICKLKGTMSGKGSVSGVWCQVAFSLLRGAGEVGTHCVILQRWSTSASCHLDMPASNTHASKKQFDQH